MLRTLITLSLIVAAATARADDQMTLYSKMLYAPPTVCDGKDHVGALIEPWEPFPIVIRGVAVSHSIDTAPPSWHGLRPAPLAFGYAFVGSSNSDDGDLLSPVITGPASHGEVLYPAGTGFRFPAKGTPNPPHIDIHMSCHGGANDQAWAVIFYTAASSR